MQSLLRKTIEIAIADDHAMVRQGIVSMLNTADDLQVIYEAANGELLLNHPSESGPTAHLPNGRVHTVDE